ncbi:MAG: hypothetical protein IKQ60_01520 [Candidatus Methanomethylophilaceae archaeon]|nr:hypothetical protein [Candidatus Methanomethylophilaceae archaeon]
METEQIVGWISDNLPQTILLVGGLIAMCVAIAYAKDKDGGKYKALMAVGFLFGVAMLYEALTMHATWRSVTSILIALTAFTLLIRPFRDVNFSIIAAIMIMAFVYIWLASFDGATLFGQVDLTPLSQGWARLIISFVAGAIVYGICRFAEAIVKFFGKLLNCWPILFVLGIVCIAEAGLMFLGYGSIFDYLDLSKAKDVLEVNL